MLIRASQGITPDGTLHNIFLEIHDGIISDVSTDRTDDADLTFDGILIPGFVDIHCHGGSGFYFSDSQIENVKSAIALHQSHGTTTLIASLVTAGADELLDQIRRLLPLVRSGELAGIHLEGPYLSPARAGAHEISLLKTPEISEIQGFLEAGEGAITMVTIAPELPGACEVITYLAENGVIAAIGHTDASPDQMKNAIDAGAQLVTHFHNAMPKFAKGIQTSADFLLADDIPLEIICDLVHLDSATLHRSLDGNTDRAILVTDAMSAAGCGDGHYRIGNLDVEVNSSVAQLKSNGALAGSTLTMDRAFINALDLGVNIEDAVAISSTNAANLLGFSEIGRITVGALADLLIYYPESKTIEKVEIER